jgi:hypothetical protein
MTQRNHHGLDVTDLADHQVTGIRHVVGVANVKDIAAAVRITDGGDVFRAYSAVARGTHGCVFGSLHFASPDVVAVHRKQSQAIEKYSEGYMPAFFGPMTAVNPCRFRWHRFGMA